MIALLRQSPNLSVVPSPSYSPAVGDSVEFSLLVYGQMRSLVGEVREIRWGNTIELKEGTDELIYRPKTRPTVVIAYSCPLPSQAVLEAIKGRALTFYPEDSIHTGEVELPLEQIAFLSRPEAKKLTKREAARAAKQAAKQADAQRERLEIEAIAELTRQQGDRTNGVLFEAERAENLHTAISLLEQERDRIKAEGGMGLKGAYIEVRPVHKRPNSKQAVWCCEREIFVSKKGAPAKSKYIGMDGSLKHQHAAAQWSRRQRFDAVCRQLEILSEDI